MSELERAHTFLVRVKNAIDETPPLEDATYLGVTYSDAQAFRKAGDMLKTHWTDILDRLRVHKDWQPILRCKDAPIEELRVVTYIEGALQS